MVFSVDESGVHVRLGNAVVRVPHLSFRNYLQGAEKMPLRIAA